MLIFFTFFNLTHLVGEGLEIWIGHDQGHVPSSTSNARFIFLPKLVNTSAWTCCHGPAVKSDNVSCVAVVVLPSGKNKYIFSKSFKVGLENRAKSSQKFLKSMPDIFPSRSVNSILMVPVDSHPFWQGESFVNTSCHEMFTTRIFISGHHCIC